jgi:hypothetical protein
MIVSFNFLLVGQRVIISRKKKGWFGKMKQMRVLLGWWYTNDKLVK